MALDREIYKAFEAVVGKDNISEDRGVLASYQCIPAQTSDHRGPYPGRTPMPQAVILPGTTEEVQKIVRLCNRYKIQFKASSTFWSTMGYIGDDYSVQIDMRRMNKFEIDAKNMFLICEPWVIGATAQAEAMKYGLNLNIPGVGCSSSPVASTSSWVGFGPQTIFMGAATENLLGCEWVLPDGEVLRTGSLGAGSGWFCGEGPGPSIRGILRGKQGTAGSFGICTKMAIRLHPWPGPTYIPSYGQAPAYKADLPRNFRCYTLCFPDWDAYAQGITYLHQAEILYLGHRQFTMFGRDVKTGMLKILNDPDGQLADLEGYVNDPELKKINDDMKIDIQVIIAGMTDRDFEYKEAVLYDILDRVGGWTSKWMSEKEMENYCLMYLLRLGHKNLNFVMCGSYEGNFGLSGNVFVSAAVMEEASALKLEWEKKENGPIALVGGDSDMGSITITGGGGTTGWEFFTHFDAYDKSSIKGTADFFNASQEWMNSKKLGVDMGKWNQTARRADGYYYTQEEHNEIHKNLPQPMIAGYQYLVREAFNPNNLCGSYYRTLDPSVLDD
jgi:glycolate oxidase